MDEFISFIAEILGVDATALSSETCYGGIRQWDSMMHLRLVMEVESKYGVDIPLDDIPKIKTLGQLFSYTQTI